MSVGPTQNYDDEKLGRWKPHPTLAVVVRVLVSALPPLVSIGFGLAAARWLPPERLGLNRWLWLVGEIACAWGLLWVSRKLARRLLPLSTLLSLGLFFPDQVPSRFRMALRAHSTKALQDRIEQRQVQGAQLRGEEQYATTLLDLIAELRAHDRLTRGHSERVQAYASMIGKELRLSEEDTAKLRWAALLHDVGKLHVPGAILNKTSRPTDREWAVLATHPQHGIELAQPLREWLGPWLDAIGQHHEKWNGTGYPAGLSGNAISYGARIVAVADTYDVITSARSYKKPMTAAAARAELARCAGTQFDPMVVRAFLAIGIGRLRLTAGPLSALASMPGLPSAPLSNLANLGSAAGGVVAVTLATAVVGLTPAAPPATPAAHEYLALAAGTVADPQSRATRRPSPHASSPAPGRHSPSPTSTAGLAADPGRSAGLRLRRDDRDHATGNCRPDDAGDHRTHHVDVHGTHAGGPHDHRSQDHRTQDHGAHGAGAQEHRDNHDCCPDRRHHDRRRADGLRQGPGRCHLSALGQPQGLRPAWPSPDRVLRRGQADRGRPHRGHPERDQPGRRHPHRCQAAQCDRDLERLRLRPDEGDRPAGHHLQPLDPAQCLAHQRHAGGHRARGGRPVECGPVGGPCRLDPLHLGTGVQDRVRPHRPHRRHLPERHRHPELGDRRHLVVDHLHQRQGAQHQLLLTSRWRPSAS